MNATYTEPVVLGDVMKKYQLAVSQAITSIWDKEIPFGTPTFVYDNFSGATWNHYHESAPICGSAPAVADDVRATEIKSRLEALGSDARQIAQSLRKQDITAYQGAPSHCAIALWMKKNFEAYGHVSVGPRSISVLANDGTHLTITTPPAVRDFIRLFDGGAFPELVVNRNYDFRSMQPLIQKTITKELADAAFSSPVPKFVPSL